MAKGFMYIFSNPVMPGLLKIGWSQKVPTERAVELFVTGVPSPFEVEYYCLTEGDESIETSVHQTLANYRHREDREFFRVTVMQARKTIESHCKPEHVWARAVSPYPDKQDFRCPSCGTVYQYRTTCPVCQKKLIPAT